MFELGAQYDVCVLIFTMDCCYIFKADPDEVARKTAQKAPFQVVEEYNMDFLKQIEKEIKPYTDGKVSVSYSSHRYLEMNALGVDKGTGLHWLADYLGIDRQDVIAIGDNYNDVDMIKEAGLGVCVQCSTQDIKEMSDYVTEVDYDQGAVREVIEKFILGD